MTFLGSILSQLCKKSRRKCILPSSLSVVGYTGNYHDVLELHQRLDRLGISYNSVSIEGCLFTIAGLQ